MRLASNRTKIFLDFQKYQGKSMSRIKITDLQPKNQVEQWELSEADITTVIGGLEVKLLGNSIVDATFGGFRLTL